MKYEIMSRTRLEECERNINYIHAKQSESEIFFEKIYNKGLNIHCLALQLYTGASKSEGRGAPGPPPPDSLVCN